MLENIWNKKEQNNGKMVIQIKHLFNKILKKDKVIYYNLIIKLLQQQHWWLDKIQDIIIFKMENGLHKEIIIYLYIEWLYQANSEEKV